jgi:hypothetical protein
MWTGISLGVAVLSLAAQAAAQVSRPSVDAPAAQPAASPGPEFRDPKTGQIWTPENVGRDKGPVKPEDRAFDPRAQAVAIKGVVEQHAESKFVANIPVTAGPTVPLVEIDNPSLRAIVGARWQVVMYLNNNSATTQSSVINCVFTNGGRKVEETRVLVPATSSGSRVALTLHGPRSEIFVDLATCRVTQP